MEEREVDGFLATFPYDGHVVYIRVFDKGGVRIMRTFDDHEVVEDGNGNLRIPKIGQILLVDDPELVNRVLRH
jgi:hypothetical protein